MPRKAIYKKPAAKSARAKHAVKRPAMQREDAKPIKKPSMKPDGIRDPVIHPCGPTEHLPAQPDEPFPGCVPDSSFMEDYNPSDEAAAIAPQDWFLEWDFLTEEQKKKGYWTTQSIHPMEMPKYPMYSLDGQARCGGS